MKKIYLGALALAVGSFASAQAPGNLDLENWTGGEPDSWEYYESTTGQDEPGTNNWLVGLGEAPSTIEETVNPAGGTGSSAKVETVAAVSGGQYETATGDTYISGFLQQDADYTDRPTEFTYDVLATPSGNDSCFIQARFYGNGGTTIGFAQTYYNSSHASWTAENQPIIWIGTGNPDSVRIIVVSSASDINQTVGSSILVDNFDFVVPNYAPDVTNVMATDISDNGNGTDLQVTFTASAPETNVANYYAIVVKSGQEGLVQQVGAQAFALIPIYAVNIAANGSATYTTVFTAPKDSVWFLTGQNLTSELIQENEPYKVVIVAEGQNGYETVYGGVSNEITLTSVGSVNETSAANFTVYPNPANENVTFNFAGANFVNAINIMGINGSLVKNVAVNGNGQVNVNVADLAKGFYVYQIVDNDGNVVKTAKFVKQ